MKGRPIITSDNYTYLYLSEVISENPILENTLETMP